MSVYECGMLRFRLGLALRGVALLAAVACDNDPGALKASGRAGELDGEQACKPGSEQRCYCLDGEPSGRQRCSSKGALEACVCKEESAATATPASDQFCKQLGDVTDCEATAYQSKELPTSMLFVLDRSRSMVCNLPPLQSSADCEADPQASDASAPSKWQITRDAFTKTFEELPVGGSLVGLSFFANDGDCGVDSTPEVALEELDGAHQQKLAEALAQVTPNGRTPIVGATILAYAHLHQEAKAPGNRYVVLMTDGAESCAPDGIDQLLMREVQRAREANIRTFVIGAPGSEPARKVLSELAYRGGTARASGCVHDMQGPDDVGDCHLDMTKSTDFAGALRAALGTVSLASQSCEFPVAASDQPDNVNVQYTPSSGATPECFSRDDKPCDGEANGWQFARRPDGKPDTSKVVLCGAACERIRKDPTARVDILVGCQTIFYQ